MSASLLLGLFGYGVLGFAVIASLIEARRLPVGARYAAMLVTAFAVFGPIGDLSLAAYARGVAGDLSITTLVLAGAACITQLSGRELIAQRDRRALCWVLALAAAFLYPFALGWTPFDPYALGYGSIDFTSALLLVALGAWRLRLNLVVLVILAAVLAHLAGAYESRNLWDTLIDPLVSVYALVGLFAPRAVFPRPASQLP